MSITLQLIIVGIVVAIAIFMCIRSVVHKGHSCACGSKPGTRGGTGCATGCQGCPLSEKCGKNVENTSDKPRK